MWDVAEEPASRPSQDNGGKFGAKDRSFSTGANAKYQRASRELETEVGLYVGVCVFMYVYM
jgi:hypothetical protein